jgi:isopenicillin-N epimerase
VNEELARHWTLDPERVFLNHGSFGACPRPVLELQSELRAELEASPVAFMGRSVLQRLDPVRAALGSFVGADADDLALVPNATTGVNTVLRSVRFEPGDELLTTDHAYRACRNALDWVAQRAGARVVVAPIPFPLDDPEQVVASVLGAVTARTKLALLDHVTSATGMVLPLESLVKALAEHGVDTLVDGAHAPGMLDLDLAALGAAYYTGNCHKWLCTPKGSAFLHVRRDRQASLVPLAISHGASFSPGARSRFRHLFDWNGTDDPTAFLCIPRAIEFLGGLLPGGWDALRAHNHDLVVRGRRLLLDRLEAPAPCPESMLGSLATVPLPPQATEPGDEPLTDSLPLHRALLAAAIEVPVFCFPAPPTRWLRISAQLYNDLADVERLADTLSELLEAEAS